MHDVIKVAASRWGVEGAVVCTDERRAVLEAVQQTGCVILASGRPAAQSLRSPLRLHPCHRPGGH